jgi:hypothetical protein
MDNTAIRVHGTGEVNYDMPVRIIFEVSTGHGIPILTDAHEEAIKRAISSFLESQGIRKQDGPDGLVGFVLTEEHRGELTEIIKRAGCTDVCFSPLTNPSATEQTYAAYRKIELS